MAAGKKVWGIDLGQCALKALCLRADGDEIEVVDHLYIEHERILSQPEVDRKGMIESAMREFTDKHDLNKDDLVVGVPGQHTLSRFSKLPPVDKKKIPEIVKYEAQQQIPFDMDEVIWDYQVFEDEDAAEMEVGIFAMRRELLRDQLFYVSDLNLEPLVVQSNPLALYNALKFDGIIPEDEPMVIVDIGAQNTDLVVANKDSLWTRNIPLGGNNFTETLMKTFKLSFRKAENLKRNAGSHKYARQIFQAMRPVFADLVAEVQRSLGFYTSSRRGIKLKKLVAMGNAFKLPGMVKFVQQNLNMEIVRPNAYQKLAAGDAPRAPELLDRLLSYGVAYGLALQGLNKGTITSNLLPPEIAKTVVWRKKVPFFYGAAASLLLAAGAIWVSNRMDMGTIANAATDARPVNYSTGDDPENPQVDNTAKSHLQGNPPGDSPLVFAKNVISLGSHFKSVLSTIESTNDQEIEAVKDISGLQKEKVVWPRILQMIHGSLPVPDSALNQAIWQGADALKALVESDPDTYARREREVIFIESMQATYSPDVMQEFKSMTGTNTPSDSGGGRAGYTPPPTGPEQKGFIITITGITPNKGGYTFVEKQFLERLEEAGEAIEGMYIPEADFFGIGCKQLKNVSGARTTTIGSTNSGLIDPVTQEPTGDDWKFEVIFPVVLGEPGEAPAPAGGGNAPANNVPGFDDGF